MIEVVNTLKLDPDLVQEYWQKLYMDNTLKFRMGELVTPDWTDVKTMIANKL